ncbi:MAG: beta-N-acetylhexosaminidase [Bacteroidales bacterium]
MKKVLIVLAIFFLISTDNTDAMTSNSKFLKNSIIPEPVKVVTGDDTFNIGNNTLIVAPGEDQLRSAAFLNSYISKYYGFKLEVVSKAPKAKSSKGGNLQFINLSVSDIGYSYAGFSPSDLKKEGAYALSVKEGVANLKGANPQGLFYAVQTLIQLLPTIKPVPDVNSGVITLPVQSVDVVDYPRFEYRGMHLDVVRHIYSVEYVKQYIDYLALHKMNYFHWHLTDDQAWRMESKKYPKLNEVGSWRAGTIIGIFPGTGVDSTRYGGFYTVEQMKDIVNYAADRYITVVPEIDVPGHSMAIISSYPQFSTTPDIPKQPAITWGIFDRQNNVLAPSEEVFTFLKDVFNELMDVFPGKYIHIGADECSKIWWRESLETQNFMKRYGLKNEDELQSYFVKRISEVITARGRQMVGWDEIMDGGLVEGAVVMSWRDAEHGWKAAGMGHKAILTPMLFSYFNVAQKQNEEALGHNEWYLPIDSVYMFEPVPEELSQAAAANILGGQGCMWTEYFPDKERLEYGVFPRISAISEVYWSQRKSKNWPRFQLKLIDQFNRYDLWGTKYSTEIFDSGHYSR